jgi:predicted DNA-binding transcriptional regulator YafY
MRFTSEELLALQVALAAESEPPWPLVRRLAGLNELSAPDAVPAVSAAPVALGEQAAVVDLARRAATNAERLRLSYAGEGSDAASERTVQVHEVVHWEGKFYLIAWCELAGDWRRFRADRVIEAALTGEVFERRSDVPEIEDPRDLFQADVVDEVAVRFSPEISRWVKERYRDAEEQKDGSVVVRFRTASADWLVRFVLQYGADAEVLGPPAYREAVRRAVAPQHSREEIV